jgi:iron complex outermembrane receptor protein
MNRTSRISAASLTLCLLPPLAQAQSADTAQLPEVVVTATRTAASAFDVPASVDAVSADEINANKLGVNLSENLGGIPGVLARDRQDYAQDQQISVRGFGANAPFGIVGVRLYVDGIPASFPDGQGQVSHFNLDSAGRVEVMRGPFSALYGNAAGGVIQLFTADGTARPQVDVGAVGGRYGTYRASVNARGTASGVGYNLDFTHFATDGFRDHSSARRESGNAKFTLAPFSGNRMTVLFNTVSLPEAQDPGGITLDQFHADPSQVASSVVQYDARKSVEQSQGGIVDEQSLGDGQTLRVMAYYGNRIVRQFLSTPQSAQLGPRSSGGVVDLHIAYGGGDLRWISRGDVLGGPLTAVAGIGYDNESEHRRGYQNFLGSDLGVQGALQRDEIDDVYNLDPYLQLQWQPDPAWVAMLGVRHSSVRFRFSDRYIMANNPDDSGRAGNYATTPVAGLLYKITPQLHAYAAFGEGFDTPTIDQLAYPIDSNAGGLNLSLEPARSNNGELGLKWRWHDALAANVAAFRSITRNEIVVYASQGGRTTYQNAGRVRRQGLEAEFNAALGGGWHWNTAYTYVDAVYRESYLTCASRSCSAPSTLIPAGNRLPGVPESTLYSALQWGDSAHAGWNARLEGNYLSPVPVNDVNTDAAPAYGLLGVNGGYVWDWPHVRVQAYLRVDNLLDTNYVGAVVVDDSNQRYYEPGPGRSVFGGIDLRWRS